MSRWLEFRLDKLIDDVIVKGSLRAAINGLVFEMNDPISGIRYLGHSIPTFALQYRRYIDERKLSNRLTDSSNSCGTMESTQNKYLIPTSRN